MNLFAKPKLELVSKTLMDLMKVLLVASGLFAPSVPRGFRLTVIVFLFILFFVGWAVCPADKEEARG